MAMPNPVSWFEILGADGASLQPGGPTIAHFADPEGNVMGLTQAT